MNQPLTTKDMAEWNEKTWNKCQEKAWAEPEALRLADALTAEPDCNCCATNYFECVCDAIWPEQWVDNAAAELRRLHRHEVAFTTWLDKTEWVQQTARPSELGMHRADVLRARLENAEAQRDALLEALKFIADHDLRGTDLTLAGHMAHGFIGKARTAIIKAVEGEKT